MNHAKRSIRVSLRSLLVLAATFLWSLPIIPPALAQTAPPCNPSGEFDYLHVGYSMSPFTAAGDGTFYEGSRAIINVPDRGVSCTGNASLGEIYPFAMIADDDAGFVEGGELIYGWAQAGWLSRPGEGSFHLSQSVGSSANTLQETRGYGASLNTAYSYRIEYVFGGCFCLKMYVGTDLLETSRFDPYCGSCGGWGVNSGKTWVAQWQTETYDPGSDIPGTLTRMLNFTGIETQRCCDEAWVTNFQTPTNINPNNAKPGLWHSTLFQNRSFSLWRGLPDTQLP